MCPWRDFARRIFDKSLDIYSVGAIFPFGPNFKSLRSLYSVARHFVEDFFSNGTSRPNWRNKTEKKELPGFGLRRISSFVSNTVWTLFFGEVRNAANSPTAELILTK